MPRFLTGSRDYNNDPQTWETATDAILWGVIRAVDDAEFISDGYPSFWPTVAEYARDEIQRRRRSVAA